MHPVLSWMTGWTMTSPQTSGQRLLGAGSGIAGRRKNGMEMEPFLEVACKATAPWYLHSYRHVAQGTE